MRVISQDGLYDIPCDSIVVSLSAEMSKIYARNAYSGYFQCVLAEYSNKEKALKVIDMFRKAYKEYSAMNITTNGLGQTLVQINDTEENRKILASIVNDLMRTLYFRFPEDSEV